MTEKYYITDITQKAIIEHDGKFLLVRDSEDDLWEIPGGRLNEGESPDQGLKREIREEIGVDIDPVGVFDVFIFRGKSNHFAVVYRCELVSSPDAILANEEISEVRWVADEDITDIPMRMEYRLLLNKYVEKVHRIKSS